MLLSYDPLCPARVLEKAGSSFLLVGGATLQIIAQSSFDFLSSRISATEISFDPTLLRFPWSVHASEFL